MASEKRKGTPSAKFPRVRRHSFDSESLGRLKQLEKGFVLDGIPLSKLANDETGRTQPSLNMGIPQYSAINDSSCKGYFSSKGLPNSIKAVAKKSGKKDLDILAESAFEKFLHSSAAQKYLQDRGKTGAGYTRQIYGGHLSIPTAAPTQGYHGEEGYRRNTPDLRLKRSVFDYEDPFENPKPLIRPNRIHSAPTTIRMLRLKSAKIYHEVPRINKRAMSALPVSVHTRELSTGPDC